MKPKMNVETSIQTSNSHSNTNFLLKNLYPLFVTSCGLKWCLGISNAQYTQTKQN